MAEKHIVPKEGLAKIAARMAAEDDVGLIWLGRHTWLIGVYDAKYGSGGIPGAPQRIRNTLTAISRSPLFERAGYIRSFGFSARETLHPCFRLRTPTSKEQPHAE